MRGVGRPGGWKVGRLEAFEGLRLEGLKAGRFEGRRVERPGGWKV